MFSPIWPERCPPITWMLHAGIADNSLTPPASAISFEATRLPRSWQRLGAMAFMQVSRYMINTALSSFSWTTVSTFSKRISVSAGDSFS